MAAEGALHQFGNILLGGRGGTNPGQLKIHPGGFVWRKTGGGKVVDVSKADISALSWTRLPKGYQLGVKMRAGSNVKFSGFREQDVASLNPFLDANLGITPEERPLAISGRNWGEAELDGNMLSFVVGGKQAFEVSIADVSQTQMMGKNDVVLEFHVDDTTGANEKDTLMELSFHVPSTNSTYIGDEERPSAQVFFEKIKGFADLSSTGTDAIALFEEIGVLTPRGRYNVELHLSFLRLQGQANDFKIQYNSVVRLFILPKSNQPHTFVVITLDPPIRKGQTFYPHIVLQFPSEEITECSLSIQDDLLSTKYKDRLQPHYKDLSHDVFTQILKGLLGAKVTRPGNFRSSQDGYSVRASLKAEEGTLYPLEKSFFFLPKPPTLILHDEIEYVEFERHGLERLDNLKPDLAVDSRLPPPARVGAAGTCLPPLKLREAGGLHKLQGKQGFRWTIRDYAEAYRSGSVTPTMVAERFLSALEETTKLSPGMFLFINFDEQEILRQAEASTSRYMKGEPLSVLDGVPIAVKDEIDCLPYPTTGGSKWLHKVRLTKEDAMCVKRLRECGAVLVGKTNMHELGMGTTSINPHYGGPRNPYGKDRVSGESSGGSAASVAAGLCPAALGVDGGGSVRMPAGLCGVVGFKATFGRTSSAGAHHRKRIPEAMKCSSQLLARIRQMTSKMLVTATVHER